MSKWTVTTLETEAARTTDTRTARVLKRLIPSLRARRAPWEEELISRLCTPAALIIELGLDLIIDPIELLCTISEESGAYRLARNTNTDGTEDFGPLMENDIHGRTLNDRLTWLGSLTFLRDVLAPRRRQKGQHPLSDYNAWSSGRAERQRPYAVEAWTRVNKPHPKWGKPA